MGVLPLRRNDVVNRAAIEAFIAALASEFEFVVFSSDTDFLGFPDVKVVNPL